LYGYITDEHGVLIPDAANTIDFHVSGGGQIVGPSSVRAEAGIATVLLKGSDEGGKVTISASAAHIKPAVLSLELKK